MVRIKLNIYIFLTQGQKGDVEGRVAVGGDVRLDDFEIGLKVPGGDNCDTHGLVARGKVYMYQGRIHGQIDCTSDGSTWWNNYPNCQWTYSYQPWIDFDATRRALISLSEQLGGLQTTGTFTDSGRLTLRVNFYLRISKCAKGIDFEVVKVSANFFQGKSLSVTGGKRDATLVINVEGGWAGIQDMRDGFNMAALDAFNTVINFYQADTITLKESNFRGHVLAPKAEVQGERGQMIGQIIAKKMLPLRPGNDQSFSYMIDLAI
jgi:choice-of-anchor A domain-containing protein